MHRIAQDIAVSMQCTAQHKILWSMCSALHTSCCTVHCTAHSVQCTVKHTILRSVCSALYCTRYCGGCAVHCRAQVVHYTPCALQCTAHLVLYFQCKILGSCSGVVEDFTHLGSYMHSLAVGNWPLEMGINILCQNISTQLLDYTMLHSTAVKASNSNVNSQNTKYHQDKFHIFTQKCRQKVAETRPH